jgi:RNA polymerase sigma-70 factor (ECF subfamily)
MEGAMVMTAPGTESDERLMALLARGDRAAFETLTRRHLRRVYALARCMVGRKEDAEDVAQEVFTRLWVYAPRWREGEAAFTTWLHRITVNCCYDFLKKNRGGQQTELPETLRAPGRDPEENYAAAESGARLRGALKHLPERQRMAVTLSYFGGMTNAAGAAAMELHLKAFEGLLVRARRALRDVLEEKGS